MRPYSSFILLVLLFLVSACASTPQTLKPGTEYQRDAVVEVNGRILRGVDVAPYAEKYALRIQTPGKIDLLQIATCARVDNFTGYELEKEKSGGFLGLNKKIEETSPYQLIPDPELEGGGLCPLIVEAIEREKGRNSWAFIAFEHPRFQLKAHGVCNGVPMLWNGVGACQSKRGVTQKIQFADPVQSAPAEPVTLPGYTKAEHKCDPMLPVRDAANKVLYYEYDISLKECVYSFRNAVDERFQLYTIGYEGVLVRPWDEDVPEGD